MADLADGKLAEFEALPSTITNPLQLVKAKELLLDLIETAIGKYQARDVHPRSWTPIFKFRRLPPLVPADLDEAQVKDNGRVLAQGTGHRFHRRGFEFRQSSRRLTKM